MVEYHINHAAVYSVSSSTSPCPSPSPFRRAVDLQLPMPTPWPTGTAVAIVNHKYSMSNQQPTGSSWNFPAGKTPYLKAPSHAQTGGYANIAPGATYNSQEAGATASATFQPAPAPQRGPTIAQPGPSYAPAPPGAAYAPATPGAAYAPAPPGASYAPAPSGATYAPLCDLATRSRVVYPTGRGREVESQSHERSARLKPCTRGVGD